VSRRPNSEITF